MFFYSCSQWPSCFSNVDTFCLLSGIQVPSVGEFGLEIYASDPETDGQSMFHAYQYLIVCDKLQGDPPMPYPALPMSYLGPQPGFHSLGLSLDVDDPYQVVDSGELAISFVTSKRVRLTAQLLHFTAAATEDCSQYVLQQAESEHTINFIVRLPKLGTYKLQVGFFHCTYVEYGYIISK